VEPRVHGQKQVEMPAEIGLVYLSPHKKKSEGKAHKTCKMLKKRGGKSTHAHTFFLLLKELIKNS